ncbi:ATP-binding protein [Actinoplanes sp. CA-030573]|uniref:ATP-binding protein n=1 Tax=Actinoplanes sp. CA-030573 TaxID=3239898 RepID=UPI003D8ADB07
MGGGSHISPVRRGPALQEDQTSPTVEVIGTEVLLTETFDHSSITVLRHAIASCARGAGLVGDRLDDFVVAVNELLSNAVRHGGGRGRVALWRQEGSVVCEVSDAGAGIADPRPARAARPAIDQPGGWGLWLAEELTDSFELTTGSGGTTVRVSSAVSLRES